MKRIACALVALLVIVANVGAAYAATSGGFPSTPRFRDVYVQGVRLPRVQYVVKQTTEQRASTVTIADDSELTIPVEASTYYRVTTVVKFCGSTTGAMGFRHRIVTTGGVDTSSSRVLQTTDILATTTTATAGVNDAADVTVATISVCNSIDMYVKSGIVLTSSAGVIKLQWAQSTSNAANLNVFRGSFLMAERVGP